MLSAREGDLLLMSLRILRRTWVQVSKTGGNSVPARVGSLMSRNDLASAGTDKPAGWTGSGVTEPLIVPPARFVVGITGVGITRLLLGRTVGAGTL